MEWRVSSGIVIHSFVLQVGFCDGSFVTGTILSDWQYNGKGNRQTPRSY